MGAEAFSTISYGKSADDAFRTAKIDAEYEHGHAGYTGTIAEKDSFVMPEFCLVDVTQEKFGAGGMLAGKSYEDIEQHLKRFGYVKLISTA